MSHSGPSSPEPTHLHPHHASTSSFSSSSLPALSIDAPLALPTSSSSSSSPLLPPASSALLSSSSSSSGPPALLLTKQASSATSRFLSHHLPAPLAAYCIHLHSQAKSWLYVLATTILLLLLFANSLSRLLKSLWSDVGNNWQYAWSLLHSFGFADATLYITFTSMIHMFTFWTHALFLTYYDVHAAPHSFTRYKIQPAKHSPIDKQLLARAVRVVLRNQVIVGLPFQCATYPLAVLCGVRFDEALPTFTELITHIVIFMIIEEVGFYYIHRLMHQAPFYGWIHKQHHEFTAPIAVAAIYCHPLEHLLSNLLPVLLGPLCCSSHLAVIWVWHTLAVLNSINSHSGYHFPFFPSPEAHDFHHLRFNVNYGVLGLLDWVHGTDRAFTESKQYTHHKTYFSFNEYRPVISSTTSTRAVRAQAAAVAAAAKELASKPQHTETAQLSEPVMIPAAASVEEHAQANERGEADEGKQDEVMTFSESEKVEEKEAESEAEEEELMEACDEEKKSESSSLRARSSSPLVW